MGTHLRVLSESYAPGLRGTARLLQYLMDEWVLTVLLLVSDLPSKEMIRKT